MKKRKKGKSPKEQPTPDVTLAEEFGEAETAASPSAPTEETPEVESASDEQPTNDESSDRPEEAVEETPIETTVPSEDTGEESSEEPTDGVEDPATEENPAAPFPLSQIVEAILFASQKPVSPKELISILKSAAEAGKENPNSPAAPYAKVKEPHLRAAIEELENACMDASRTYEVRENAAGWQLVTKADFSPWLRQLYPENRSARMSAPAMETLAIIAYRQPITRADIEAVRGVAVDGVMQTLLDRGLVKIAGRAEVPGRPLLYETTQHFMEHFGLKNLDDLPNAGELRAIKLPQAVPAEAEAPATSEAPADTAPEPAAETPAETPAEEAPAEVPEDTESADAVSAEEAAEEKSPETEAEKEGEDAAPDVETAEEPGEEDAPPESPDETEEEASQQP